MAVLQSIRNFFAAPAINFEPEIIVPAPPTVYEIHPLTDKQLKEVLILNLRCFKAGENYTKHTFAYLLGEPNSLSYRAVTPTGQMTAFVFIMTSREDGTGHITTIGVAPEHRRRGLANKLLRHAEDALRRRGINAAMLEVRASNRAAQNLYRASGYAIVQRLPKYYNNGEDGFLMVKSLSSESKSKNRNSTFTFHFMKFILPKIYPITNPQLAKISHAAQVEKLIEGGATFVQLRDKNAAPNEFYDAAEAAIKIARTRSVKIIFNDRVDIALALRADGVHLGQDDLPPEQARKILGDEAIIGFSTHTLEQAIKAIKLPINYLAIGPVFTTLTKANPDETVGIETVRRAREIVGDFPLVAIGGITTENFREVLAAGANSAAIISDLISDPEIITRKMQMFLTAK